MSAIGRSPSVGITKDSAQLFLSMVPSDLPSRRFFSISSEATAEKVLARDTAVLAFSTFFCWPGSTPEANSVLTSSRKRRASLRPTAGHAPKDAFFCLPSKR